MRWRSAHRRDNNVWKNVFLKISFFQKANAHSAFAEYVINVVVRAKNIYHVQTNCQINHF